MLSSDWRRDFWFMPSFEIQLFRMSTIQEKGNGKKRIVIVGAGFAGLHTYVELHNRLHGRDDIFITLINKTDYFVFIPMIHEVAVGNLLPSSITQSLRVLPQCCLGDFIEAEVESVDLDKRSVRYKQSHSVDGDDSDFIEGDIQYDFLVLASGSRTNYFGVSGAREYAMTLQSLDDARRMKNHILHRFEEAQVTEDGEKKKELMTFVIIGGGATGVELAGELSDLFTRELRNIYPELYPLSRIKLIHSGDRLLSQSEAWFAEKTKKILEKGGKIDIMLGSSVDKIEKNAVFLGDTVIRTETIIWAGGVTASDIKLVSALEVKRNEKDQRIPVERTLNLKNYKNVFVLGDLAWVPERTDKTVSYPMRAQFAVRQGRTAGENIARLIDGAGNIREFDWRDSGFIVSLGKGGALADISGIKLSGFLAWWLYRTAYLMKIFGARAKIRTVLEWTLNLFLPRDLREL